MLEAVCNFALYFETYWFCCRSGLESYFRTRLEAVRCEEGGGWVEFKFKLYVNNFSLNYFTTYHANARKVVNINIIRISSNRNSRYIALQSRCYNCIPTIPNA